MADPNLIPAPEILNKDSNLIPADLGGPTAQDNVIHGSFGNADAAGKAVTLAPKVLMPAEVVNGNYESVLRDQNRAEGLKAVEQKSLLQHFAERSAIHAEVAQDDWSNATQMANQIGWLTKDGHEKKVDAALYASSPEGQLAKEYLKRLGSPFGDYAQQIKERSQANSDAFWSAFADKSRVDQGLDELEKSGIIDKNTRYAWELSMIPTAGRAIEGLMSGGVGAAKFLASDLAGRFVDIGGEKMIRKAAELVFTEDGSGLDDKSGPKKFAQDVQTGVDAELVRSMADHPPIVTHAQMVKNFNREANKWLTDPKYGELTNELKGFQEPKEGPSVRNDITEFLRQRTTGEWDSSKFASPELKKEAQQRAMQKPVGEPVKPADSIEVIKAEVAAETLNDAIEVAKESKILKRSPQVFDDLINSEGNAGTVYVNAQAVADLYKGAKKEPHAGDGLLGDVPGLMDRVAKAASTGAEVGIPLSRYIIAAAQNPTMHTALAEHIRLHSDGTTLAEAAVMKKQEPHSEAPREVNDRLLVTHPEVFTDEGETVSPGPKEVSETADVEPMAEGVEGEEAPKPLATPPGPKSLMQREVEAERAVEIAKIQAAREQAKTGEEPEAEPQAGSMEAKEAEGEDGLEPAAEKIKGKTTPDASRMARMFGKKMYSITDLDTITVKELMQNSFDALKSLIEKGGGKNAKIEIKMDPRDRTITITDNGSGMTGETLAGPFITIGGTLKETASPSGGFGIAKVLTLYENKRLRAYTLRDGKLSTLDTSGKQLDEALRGIGEPDIISLDLSELTPEMRKEVNAMFPGGHGTRVEIVIPESYVHPTTHKQEPINFRTTIAEHGPILKSPLFRDIEVTFDGGTRPIGAKTSKTVVDIGKNFPLQDFVPLGKADFGWGTARIYISKNEKTFPWGQENTHILSNGIYQFSTRTANDPSKPHDKKLPRELYIDTHSNVQADELGYPFDMNRRGFAEHAAKDLQVILNYISIGFKQSNLAVMAHSFGSIQYYDRSGKLETKKIDLTPPVPVQDAGLAPQIDQGANMVVKDGKLTINGKEIPTLDLDEMRAAAINIDELKIDQGLIDPQKVMLHDNIDIIKTEKSAYDKAQDDVKDYLNHLKKKYGFEEGIDDLDKLKYDRAEPAEFKELTRLETKARYEQQPYGVSGSEYVSLVDAAREEFGDRFDKYVFGIGDAFKEIRNAVAELLTYPNLDQEGVGISFDTKYRGVSILVPFKGMFINPAGPVFTDPVRAGLGMIGTMVHEIAHHQVRSHNAQFPAEMQKIDIYIDEVEYLLKKGMPTNHTFNLSEFKDKVIDLVREHEDVLKWLHEKLHNEDYTTDTGLKVVKNRGKRFDSDGDQQIGDGGVSDGDQGPARTVRGGYEGLEPARQELGQGEESAGVAGEDRGTAADGGTAAELKTAAGEANKTPGAVNAAVAIKRERRSLYLDPILTKGKTLNIDQVMYRRLSDLVERKELHILEKAIEIARKRAKQEVSAAWKEEAKKLEPKVERALLNTPAWKADRYFNWDKGNIGGGKRLPVKDMTELGKDGVESWAEFFGFESGSQMVQQVLMLESERTDRNWTPKKQLAEYVEAGVKHQMEQKHGTLNDAISIAASDEALASWNLDLLDQELKMLAAAHGVEPPLTRDQLNSWQAENFGNEIASDVSYEQKRRDTERNGKGVEKALLKEDPTEALMKMQARIKSYLLAREAKRFEKERAKAERLFDKYSSAANLPRVDQEYTDQIQKLLKSVGWKVQRTIENIDYNLQGKGISQFIAEKKGQGRLMVEAPLPMGDTGPKKLEEFTVNEYRDFVTMIQSMDHNGRFEKVIEVRGKREEFYEVIDRIAKSLDRMEKKGFDPYATGVVSMVRATGRHIDSKLLKAERLIDWIDKNDPHGPMNTVVLRPLIEGEQAKADMMTKLAGLARKIPGDMAWSHSLNDRIPTNSNWSLRDDMGEIIQHTNEQKLAIALNYGNQGNRDVLTRAHGWTEAAIEAFLANSMSATDWKVVNAIHDLFKPLAPLVEAATRERSGVAIPLVDALPFLGSDGGYFPLVRDPRDVLIGVKKDVDLFDKTKFDPLPMAPALKTRTGKVYKLDLSLNSLNGILSQTNHAVHMQGPVVNANKVLTDPFVREGIVKAFGPEYVQMLDEWIRDIANNGGEHDSSGLSWVSRTVRQNVVTALMGYKVSTALIHGGSAGASSVYELGKLGMEDKGGKAFATAPLELIKNIAKLKAGNLPSIAQKFFTSSSFTQMYDEAQAQSGELRNRQRTAQSNLEFQMGKILRKNYLDEAGYWKAMYQTYSMAMVSYIDLLTATPVWLGVRDAELAKGTELEDAIFIADKAVREAHGSASLVSRANVGRGEGMKWLTIAYNGYWNHNYNKYRSESKAITALQEEPRTGGREEHDFDADEKATEERLSAGVRIAMGSAFITAFIIAPAIIHHAVRGKEEETLAGSIAAMGTSQLLGTVPVLGSLAYAAIHNRDPAVSPIDNVLKSATDVWRDIISKKHAKHPISHAFKAAGYFTGYAPTNQMLDTASFVNEVLNGKTRVQTPGQWARGVLSLGDKGKKP